MTTLLKLTTLAAMVALTILGATRSTAHAQSTLNPAAHQAWAGNLGWIDARPGRPAAGDGIRVHDTFLSGYAWSANTGWINFGDGSPSDVIRYANTSNFDYGVNHDGAGNLSGLAWSANTGWINFGWAALGNTNRPRFDLSTGEFSGYAWSANCGWIHLGSGLLRTDSMIRVDADGDGIADTWEREHAGTLPVLTTSGDADGDGTSDRDEYLLDTDPLTPNAPFRITRVSKLSGGDAVELAWPSSPRRVYAIEGKLDLSAPAWLFLASVSGAAGTNTVQAIEQGPPNAVFRIGGKLPLLP